MVEEIIKFVNHALGSKREGIYEEMFQVEILAVGLTHLYSHYIIIIVLFEVRGKIFNLLINTKANCGVKFLPCRSFVENSECVEENGGMKDVVMNCKQFFTFLKE